MNLHELDKIIRKAGPDEAGNRCQRDAQGAQPFTPVSAVIMDNGFNVVLVNRRVVITDSGSSPALFIERADGMLITGVNLGIWYYRGKEHSVGSTTDGTSDATYPETQKPGRKLYVPGVIRMNRETGGMTAGTGKLLELKAIYNRIIEGLRNVVAILDKYSYHGYVDTRDSLVFDEKWQAELSRVGACCLFMGIEPNDNRRHHIKQSDVNSIRMIYAVPLFNLTENRGRQGNRKGRITVSLNKDNRCNK